MSEDREDRPIRRLDGLGITPGEGFGERLRRRLQRRVLTGDLANLGLSGFAHTLLTYLMALFGLADPRRNGEGTNNDRGRHHE